MEVKTQIITEKQVRNKTLLAFFFFFVFIAVAFAGWQWLNSQPKDQGTLKPLRKVLDANEFVFINFFNKNKFAKTFPKSMSAPVVRVNGSAGLKSEFNPATWKLTLIRNPGDTQFITLEEIKSLPKTEIIFDFKCIEGWSQVSHWGGVRFSDFVKKYNLDEQARLQFTGLITPDSGYYVGIDNRSMMHPQTLLCYEMNGKPLLLKHGAPLRLIIPVKYGVKHIKRIGTIFFSSQRPPDYWFEQGYDYYSGL